MVRTQLKSNTGKEVTFGKIVASIHVANDIIILYHTMYV